MSRVSYGNFVGRSCFDGHALKRLSGVIVRLQEAVDGVQVFTQWRHFSETLRCWQWKVSNNRVANSSMLNHLLRFFGCIVKIGSLHYMKMLNGNQIRDFYKALC